MPARLVALDEGPDINLDRAMVVVGRHPSCDTRLDSLRVSRHHCCMTQENGEVMVRDLGSTNGIRINGQRVEIGRMRPGDELSIAHIRYRLGEWARARADDRRSGRRWESWPDQRTRNESRRSRPGRRMWSPSVMRAKMPSPRRFASCFPTALLTSVGFKSSSRWRATPARMKQSQFPWCRTTPRRTPPNVIPTRPTDSGNRPDHRLASSGPLDRPASRV